MSDGLANSYGMAISGPNSAGIANFAADSRVRTTNSIDLEHIKKGNVALLSASGALGNTVFIYCQRRVGLCRLVGIGDGAVSTAAGFLDVLVTTQEAGDPGNIEAVGERGTAGSSTRPTAPPPPRNR